MPLICRTYDYIVLSKAFLKLDVEDFEFDALFWVVMFLSVSSYITV